MTPEERQRRAGNYAAMMSSEAWKDLEKWAKEESAASHQRMDDTAASELNLAVICEERGLRKGIEKLLKHADYCRAGV